MKRVLCLAVAALTLVASLPSRADADATAFWGYSPTPSTRGARGFAVGVSLLIVGFEFEYANTSEDDEDAAPGVRTGMVNALVQTPTSTQLYLTAGGGFYREKLGDASETNFGTNIGGGIKIALAGPLRLRVDYRLFNLRGSALYTRPQRVYFGANLTF